MYVRTQGCSCSETPEALDAYTFYFLGESLKPRGGGAVGSEHALTGVLARMEARIARLEQQLGKVSPTEGEER